MTDKAAMRVLHALDEDESRPRYCSDAGAADLHRMNAEAIRFALQSIDDRAALVESFRHDDDAEQDAARDSSIRHMRGEP